MEEKICPECGKPMKIKKRNSDGKEFWGCTGYPNCHHAEDIVNVVNEQGEMNMDNNMSFAQAQSPQDEPARRKTRTKKTPEQKLAEAKERRRAEDEKIRKLEEEIRRGKEEAMLKLLKENNITTENQLQKILAYVQQNNSNLLEQQD